jgi:hypothetical protein
MALQRKDRELLNGKSDSTDPNNPNDPNDSTDNDRLGVNSDNSDEKEGDDPSASKPAEKKVWSVEKGWVTVTPANSQRGADGLSSRDSSSAYRSDTFTLSDKRNSQNDLGFASRNDKTGLRRMDDRFSSSSADSQKSSLMEKINQYTRNAYSYGSLDPEGPHNLYGLPANAPSSSTPGFSLYSPNDSTDSGGTPDSQKSLLGADPFSEKAPGKANAHIDLAPDQRAWSEPAPVSEPSLQRQNPYVPPSQGQGSSQSHPANLPFPKQPGSLF